MPVADLAREMARRYLDDAGLTAGWASVVLKRLPPAMRQPAHVDELCAIHRRVVEEQAVEHFTIAELAALARFYATPEGRSIGRKGVAFTTAITSALEAEFGAWAARVRPQPSAGEVARDGGGVRLAGHRSPAAPFAITSIPSASSGCRSDSGTCCWNSGNSSRNDPRGYGV